jgi:hypothetical protein
MEPGDGSDVVSSSHFSGKQNAEMMHINTHSEQQARRYIRVAN